MAMEWGRGEGIDIELAEGGTNKVRHVAPGRYRRGRGDDAGRQGRKEVSSLGL